jgi:histidinol-phosphate aminotransferase
MNLFNKRTNELNPYVVSTRIIDSDEDWLVLDWNESTNKIDNYIKDSLIDFVKKGELNLYGDIECTELKKKLAEVIGVEHTCLTFFNGSDSALNICFEALLDNGDKVLTIEPEYSQVNTFIHMKGGVKSSYLLSKIGKPLISDINDSLKGTKIFYFSNPNNPIGFYFDKNEIENMLISNQNTMFFVDEAYYEFCGSSAIDLISKYSNLIIFRTFSKAFGLAGIRLGYIISNSRNVSVINKIRNGKEVSSIAQITATTALMHYDQIQNRIAELVEVRDWFYNKLKELPNYLVFPSSANFLLVKHRDFKIIILELMDNNILVRDRSSMNCLEDCFRITIGSKIEMMRVLEILKKY